MFFAVRLLVDALFVEAQDGNPVVLPISDVSER
jgi:hypothetical protein